MFEWNVDPVLFRFGFIQIRYYGLLFAGAFLSGLYLLRRHFVRKGIDPLLADTLLTYLVFGIVIGARLIHVMFYNTDFYLSNPSEILKIWHGGVASHGGVLGAIAATYLFSRRYKMDTWDMLDAVAIQFILVAALIRIGNFFNSEIVGRVTHVPWAVRFPRYDQYQQVVPWRHPTQFYEVAYHLIGYFVIRAVYRKYRSRLCTGTLLSITLVWYFCARFLVEFFKEYQTLTSGLTMGQWLSIPFALSGLALIYYRQKRGPRIEEVNRRYRSDRKEETAAPEISKKKRKKR